MDTASTQTKWSVASIPEPSCAPLSTTHSLFLQELHPDFWPHQLFLPVFRCHINGICNMYSFGAAPVTQYHACEIHPCCLWL